MILKDHRGRGEEPFMSSSPSSAPTSYPAIIARCQHIKINGTQCGCPALRDRSLCFFHQKTQETTNSTNANTARRGARFLPLQIPVLEDANAVQFALLQIMQSLLAGEIEHKTAALLLYALQTASANLRHTTLQPRPELVITDVVQLNDAVIGADAWSKKTFEARLIREKEEKTLELAAQTEATRRARAAAIAANAAPTQSVPAPNIDLKASAAPPVKTRLAASPAPRQSPRSKRKRLAPSNRRPAMNLKRAPQREHLSLAHKYPINSPHLPLHPVNGASGRHDAERLSRTH